MERELFSGADVLAHTVRLLPVHPNLFAVTARAGKQLQRAVGAAREELGKRACVAHGLESARGEAAGRKLVELVEDGNRRRIDAPAVLRLVVAGAPLDVQTQGDSAVVGSTALMWAAGGGHTEIATALIGAGALLDVQDEMGFTAIMLAALNGRTEIVTALIRAKAKLDLRDGYVRGTALIMAADNNHAETVAVLIGAGAGLDVQNKDRWTALMKAAVRGHTEVVMALINAGAGLDLQDQCGCTALMRAAAKGQIEAASALIGSGAGLDVQDDFGWTAMMKAAHKGSPEIVDTLIEAGARLDLKDRHGYTALMRATSAACESTGDLESVLGVLVVKDALKKAQTLEARRSPACAVS